MKRNLEHSKATNPYDDLARRWRAEADLYRDRGQESLARMSEAYLREFEATHLEADLEELTLEQAVAASGYSYSTIQKQVADGVLQNVGDKNRPRVRRGDLPRKARNLGADDSGDEPDLVARVLELRA